eukprot:gene21479-8221_t
MRLKGKRSKQLTPPTQNIQNMTEIRPFIDRAAHATPPQSVRKMNNKIGHGAKARLALKALPEPPFNCPVWQLMIS